MANNTKKTIPDSLNNLDQSKLFNDIKNSGKLELIQPVKINVCTTDEDFEKCVKKHQILPTIGKKKDKKVNFFQKPQESEN